MLVKLCYSRIERNTVPTYVGTVPPVILSGTEH